MPQSVAPNPILGVLNVDQPGSWMGFRTEYIHKKVFQVCHYEGMTEMDSDDVTMWWEKGTAGLMVLPATAIGPVIGTAWYGMYKRAPLLLHLEGASGSGKTALARLGCQYSLPSLAPHQMAGAVWGAPVIGSTWTGLLRAVDRAPRGLFLVDDVVAGTGERKSKTRIDDLASYVSSGAARVDAGRLVPPPLASIVTTSIYAPSRRVASSTYRLRLDLARSTLSAIASLETSEARGARGALGAALCGWVEETEGLEQIEQSFTEYLRGGQVDEPVSALKQSQLTARIAAAFGIELMVMMLSEIGAADSARSQEFKMWARQGIIRDTDTSPELVGVVDDRPAIVRAMRKSIEQALAEGRAAVRGAESLDCEAPLIGEIRDGRLLLFPREAREILVAHVGDEYGPLSSIRVARALEQEGWISTTTEGKRTEGRRVNGVKRRVWELSPAFLLTNP